MYRLTKFSQNRSPRMWSLPRSHTHEQTESFFAIPKRISLAHPIMFEKKSLVIKTVTICAFLPRMSTPKKNFTRRNSLNNISSISDKFRQSCSRLQQKRLSKTSQLVSCRPRELLLLFRTCRRTSLTSKHLVSPFWKL